MYRTFEPRQHLRIYKDGNMWCAVGRGFIDLAQHNAGFGETKEEAVTALSEATHEKLDATKFLEMKNAVDLLDDTCEHEWEAATCSKCQVSRTNA